MGCSLGSTKDAWPRRVSETMGATKPTSSSGSKPKLEIGAEKTDADAGKQVQTQSAPGAKTAVEEEHHARLTKQEQTIASLGSRMDSHADAAREILETVAAMPQRLRDLEAEVTNLKAAVAAAVGVAEAAMTKSTKSAKDPLESARAEMKAAENRANRGAEALADSMKNSAMLHMRVQALEGLMQDVMLKTSALPAPGTARAESERQPAVADSITTSFANPDGPPPLHSQRDGVPPLDFAHGVRGVPPPAWGAQGGYREFAGSGQPASSPGGSPMGSSPLGSPVGSTRGTGLPSAPKLTSLVPERRDARRPGTCSAWWS